MYYVKDLMDKNFAWCIEKIRAQKNVTVIKNL